MSEAVFKVKFWCFIQQHEYSQDMFFRGTEEQAKTWADNYASSYWDCTEEDETYWDDGEKAYCAENPYRGVRVDLVEKIDSLYCDTTAGAIVAVPFETKKEHSLLNEKCISSIKVDEIIYAVASKTGTILLEGKTHFITVKEIRYINSPENYITVVMGNGLERLIPFHYTGLAFIDTQEKSNVR